MAIIKREKKWNFNGNSKLDSKSVFLISNKFIVVILVEIQVKYHTKNSSPQHKRRRDKEEEEKEKEEFKFLFNTFMRSCCIIQVFHNDDNNEIFGKSNKIPAREESKRETRKFS